MDATLKHVNVDKFLDQYWQQNPLLIRQAIDVSDVLDGNELASLAMEPEVESRLIQYQSSSESWQLTHGPFSEQTFSELPKTDWTLLVQAVDHWIPEVRHILKSFAFLPQWRIDDVMVSFATKGGGVGPHFDQYDVFLIQATGKREWKTGQLCDEESDLVSGVPVKILSSFNEQDNWVMEPGDVLYIPPGVAHWGVALEDSLTISVGFRAPSHSEIMSDFGHFLASKISDFDRYSDQNISNRTKYPHQIIPEDIERLKSIVKQYANSDTLIAEWFGQYMTEPKYNDTAVESGDWPFKKFLKHWTTNPLIRNPASRLAFTIDLLFIDGQRIKTNLEPNDLHLLCNGETFVFNEHPSFNQSEVQKTLCSLANLGAVYFEE